MGQPRPLFPSIFSLFNQTFQFTTINVKNFHPVYGGRIRTHNLLIMSLLPLPLDQDSHPSDPLSKASLASLAEMRQSIHPPT